jgi:cobalt-zinc-cadmium efflux system membrane fusion protein
MKRRKMIQAHVAVLIALCAVLVLMQSCAATAPQKPAETAAHKDGHGEEQLILYDIGPVVEGSIELDAIRERRIEKGITVNGRIVPPSDRVAQVGSFVQGRVVRLDAREGTPVRAGQVLAVLESARATEARAAYDLAESRLSTAVKRVANVRRLAAAGVYTSKPVDEVSRERAQVASELAALRAAHRSEVSDAEAEIKSCEAGYERVTNALRLSQRELERRRAIVDAGAVQNEPVEQAKREMAESRRALLEAQTSLRTAESNARRIADLHKLGTASAREAEMANAALANAKAGLEEAEQRRDSAERILAREQRIYGDNLRARDEIEPAEAAVSSAEREVKEKQAALDRARRRLSSARSDDRATALYEMERRLQALNNLVARERGVSRGRLMASKEIQLAEADAAQARAELESARAELRLLGIPPRRSGDRSGAISVVSPIDGVVTARRVELGESVEPTATMFVVMDVRNLWAELDVYEKDAAAVARDQEVRLRGASLGRYSHVGRVVQVGGAVDEKTRAVKVRASLAEPGALKPNMFVTAFIVTGRGRPALTVPREAVADEGGTKVVYIRWPDNKGWERHPVLVVGTDSRYFAIEGPKAGEQVATKGLAIVQAAVKAQMAGGGGSAMPHGHEH